MTAPRWERDGDQPDIVGQWWIESTPNTYLVVGSIEGTNHICVLLEVDGKVTALIEMAPLAAERLISMLAAVLHQQLEEPHDPAPTS